MKVNILVGARFQAKLLADFFQKNNICCHIYTSSPASKWKNEDLPGKKNVIFIPLLFRVLSAVIPFRLSRKIREFDAKLFDFLASFIMRDCDILHGWATFCLYSATKFKKQGKYFILERACPHVLYQEELLISEAKILGINYEPTSKKFVDRAIREYELADKIIVPSWYTYNSFIEEGIPKEKLEIVRLDSNFTPKELDLRKEDTNTFIVGSVGGNVLRKGFLYLVEAWQSLNLKNAKLLLKTSIDEIKKVPIIWNKIKNDSSIEVIGYMSHMEKFYKKCDVFCLTSVDDGFGMVVFEALACGRPVIATKNVGSS